MVDVQLYFPGPEHFYEAYQANRDPASERHHIMEAILAAKTLT